MEWFLIYLFVMVEKVAAAFTIGWAIFWVPFALFGIVMFFTFLGATISQEDSDEVWNHPLSNYIKKIAKIFMPIGFVLGTIGYLMPDQKQLAIIIGSGVTYNVLTSEPAQRIGGKALQLLEQKINNALEDESVEKEEGKKETQTKESGGKTHEQSVST